MLLFCFSSGRRHTRCALVTGVQTCALPISVVERYNPSAEVWITETGYSTWKHDEAGQARRFLEALMAPADRLYWYAWQDIARDMPVQEGLLHDPRHYSLGIVGSDGQPNLPGRLLLEGGPAKVQAGVHMGKTANALQAIARGSRPVPLFGGGGLLARHMR